MANYIKKFWDKFMELLCPVGVSCLLCGRELSKGDLCPDCEKALKINRKNRCERCSRPTVSIEDNFCEQCKINPNVYYDKAAAPFIYSGTALALMRAFKYHDRIDIGSYFGKYIEKEYRKLPETDIIVPVPMWDKKLLDRTYSSAEILARDLSERTGAELSVDACRKIKDTGTQTVLNPEERAENVKGCFEVVKKDKIKGKRVLIVDDVFTTGATVSELAKTLKKRGASEVYVLCAAIAVYK